MKRVLGKVVLLTGAGQELVQACARALVADGARVALCDVDEAKARKAAAAFDERTAKPFVLDPAKEADWQRCLEATIAAFGQLDGVVSGPPPLMKRGIAATSLADWRAHQDSHLLGPFLGTKNAIMQLRRFSGGSVVLISTLLGRNARADEPANASAAAGLHAMAQGAALECAQKGDNIRVNSILIDPTQAPASESVAAAVVYLISNESAYVTAIEMVVDGGSKAA